MPASSLPHAPCRAPLSCETFRPEPATRQFVWSFAPTPTSRQRVEHQYGSGPPPAFPPASTSAGVVHCLSGPTPATPGSPPASVLPRPPRRAGGLLGPCFNTGPSPRLSLHFRFSPSRDAFSHFPRGTSSLSASPPYLAFGAAATASPCTTKQHYSPRRRCSGALTRSRAAFHRLRCCCPQRPGAFHWGSPLFARRYYGDPRSFLLLALLICLSPGRPLALRAPFGPHALPRAFRVLHARHRPASLSVPCRENVFSSVSICVSSPLLHCLPPRPPRPPFSYPHPLRICAASRTPNCVRAH